MEFKIRIEKRDDCFVGFLNDERIIVVSIDEPYKIGMSTTLPSDIEKAKAIICVMQETIEAVDSLQDGNFIAFIFDGSIGLPVTPHEEWINKCL